MDDIETRMRQSARFPYTYAADWVRAAIGSDSRSDASQWRQKVAKATGKDDAQFAEELALEYIGYWAAVERLDQERAGKLKALAMLADATLTLTQA